MARPLGYPANDSNKQRPSFKYAKPADQRVAESPPVPDAQGMVTKPSGVRVKAPSGLPTPAPKTDSDKL